MMPTDFRDEILRLTSENDSEGVISFHECHAAAFAGQLSPEEFEDVYGIALPLAHFRLALKQFPDLASRLGQIG